MQLENVGSSQGRLLECYCYLLQEGACVSLITWLPPSSATPENSSAETKKSIQDNGSQGSYPCHITVRLLKPKVFSILYKSENLGETLQSVGKQILYKVQ